MEEKSTEKKRERVDESPEMPPAKKAKIGNVVTIVGITGGTSESYYSDIRYCDESEIFDVGKDVADTLILSAYGSTKIVSDMFPEKMSFGHYEGLWFKCKNAKSDEERAGLLKKLRKRVKASMCNATQLFSTLSEESSEVCRRDSGSRCVSENPMEIMVCNCATQTTQNITERVVNAWLDEIGEKNLKFCINCKLTGKWQDSKWTDE